jgi:hypothetical protein
VRVVHEEGDFYAIYGAPKRVVSYLRESVPQRFRRYEPRPSPHWVVHTNYVKGAKELDDSSLTVNHYAVMFLTRNAPDFVVEAVWKALALVHHPDRGGDSALFVRVKNAYDAIKRERNNPGNP